MPVWLLSAGKEMEKINWSNDVVAEMKINKRENGRLLLQFEPINYPIANIY